MAAMMRALEVAAGVTLMTATWLAFIVLTPLDKGAAWGLWSLLCNCICAAHLTPLIYRRYLK